MINYYELLEVDYDASEQEIKEKIKSELSKWRKRVNAPDPKRQREASERMEMLQDAEDILLNRIKKNEYDAALNEFFQQATESNHGTEYQQDNEGEDLISEANRLIDQNDIANAIVAARRATEVNGNNAYAWSTLARAHYLWGDINDALYEVNRAIGLLPNEPFFYYIEYFCHMNRKDMNFGDKLNLAEKAIDKALHIDPNNPDYIVEYALIAKERGLFNKGIDLLKDLEKKQGLNENAQDLLSQLYYDKGLSMTHRVDYNNGESLYYFTEKENAEQGRNYFNEALRYVQDNKFKQEVNKWINVADNALQYKNQYKILALFLIIVPIFLASLADGNFIMILIMAGAGYLVWKKGRVPQYKLNKSYIQSLNNR